jgi:hypothetical protein
MEAIVRGPVSLLYFTVERDDFANLFPKPQIPIAFDQVYAKFHVMPWPKRCCADICRES